MSKFTTWLKNKKNKETNKEKNKMNLEELRARYAELSDEDKKAFLQSVSDAEVDAVPEEQESVDPTPAPAEEEQDSTPVPETEVATEQQTDEQEEPTAQIIARVDSLEKTVNEIKAIVEGLRKDPQPADKDTTTELDKLTNKFSN